MLVVSEPVLVAGLVVWLCVLLVVAGPASLPADVEVGSPTATPGPVVAGDPPAVGMVAPGKLTAPMVGRMFMSLVIEFIMLSMGSMAARELVLPVAATPAIPAMEETTSSTAPDICCEAVLVEPLAGRKLVVTVRNLLIPATNPVLSEPAGTILRSSWMVLMADAASAPLSFKLESPVANSLQYGSCERR